MTVHYLNPEFSRPQADVRLGVTSRDTLKQQRLEQQLRMLALTEMLHRKLDLALLMECFFIEVQAFVQHDGLSYQLPGQFPPLEFGSRRQHAVQFELSLGERLLGDVTLQRATRFSSREERELDRIVAHLCYPLVKALEHQAVMQATLEDTLTGLNNREALNLALPGEMSQALRSETPLSLVLLDVDRFNEINESHGMSVGDDILRAVAATLANSIRESDMIFRYDQDTFVIILLGTEYRGAKVLAERLRTAIDVCFRYQNVQLVLSASAGITELVERDTPDDILGRATEALLEAKKGGRNRLRALDAPEASIYLV